MKQIKTLILSCLISIVSLPAVMAQNVPQGMKYQAVARTLEGEIIKEKPIDMMITLQNNIENKKVHYVELHNVTTNKFGLFSLTIGQGEVLNGTFNRIPWSSENIWMEIAIRVDGEGFRTLSNTKLLAVPYAFHAGTANNISEATDTDKKAKPGVPAKVWSLKGNSFTNPAVDKLGTTDAKDFIVVTDNEERLRITADGDILTGDGNFTIGGNLEVQGDSTTINKDLYVGRDVFLNFDDGFDPRGETINFGDFTTQGYGQFDKNVVVADTLFSDALYTKRINVKDEVNNGEFLATFENTNNGDGDGLLIKLGKARANDGLPDQPVDEANPETTEAFRNLLGNVYSVAQKQTILEGLAVDILRADAEFVVEAALGVGNILIDYLNDNVFEDIDIGLDTRDVFDFINSFDEIGLLPDDDRPDAGDYIIPNVDFTIPNIPGFTIDFGGDIGVVTIEPFDVTDLDFWGIPELQLTDLVLNPLNKSNEFITFADKNDIRMGGIRAQSVENWVFQYLSPVFMNKIRSAITSTTVDKKHARWHVKDLLTSAVISYKDIGVEYSSGNGDYAEWLERLDPNEVIGTGDIVAVIGGKITKNLENAEQVMAISHRPIVLGNVPKDGAAHLGNNVAFMGQIPVKIIGTVNSGDYILGSDDIKGYGRAVSPENMTIEDFKLVVGRSWDSSNSKGPKMVNTVVGLHNGDYIKILKNYERKFNETNERLQNLESKIDDLAQLLNDN